MTVFISWSGERSKGVALVFEKHLKHVIQGLPTFMSDKDIDSGTQWFQEISDQLKDASFGIICVTPDNLERPWLNFEAGAIGNQTSRGRVVPVAIGMSKETLPSPLNGYNGIDLNEDGFVRLVKSIHAVRDVTVPWDVIEAAAHRQWPDMERDLDQVPDGADGAPAPSFDLPGAVKEIRGLLRDLVEKQGDGDRLPAVFTESEYRSAVGRLHAGASLRKGFHTELAKPSLGLVRTINELLSAYEQGDEDAKRHLLELGVDPDSKTALRDFNLERVQAIKRAADELDRS